MLRRENDGFYLVTPVEKVLIDVEESSFIAVAMTREGVGPSQRVRYHQCGR